MIYNGKEIPRLGFGLMRLPMLGSQVDIEQFQQMADLFIQSGFTYFDTAFGYLGGKSEEAVRPALVERYPRESFILATKLPAWGGAKNADEAKEMLNISLARTGAGYFDFYLLHNMGEERTHYFDDYGIWDYLADKKADGVIRRLGFSFHDKAEKLEQILASHSDVDFVQLQINYADWENPTIESRLCYEVCRRYGKDVVIMEPVKGGTLAALPPSVEAPLRAVNPDASLASWAIRYAASLDGIVTVLSGMSNLAQMQDNLSYMKDFQPLNDAEQAAIVKARAALDAIPTVPCTACGYCMKGCPQHIAIYGSFQAVNMVNQYGDLKGAKGKYNWNTTGHGWNKASQCIRCGKCEKVCPQHIHIRDELSKVAETLER